MESLSWLSDLIYTISYIFPRLTLVDATHEGVLFTRGNATAVKPGLVWYWPVWSEIMTYPVKRQTIDLFTQTLVTQDRHQIIVATSVVFEITDIYKALVDTYDLEDTIRDTAQGAVKNVIMTQSFNSLHDNSEEIDETLTEQIKSDLEPYGIEVIKAFLTDFSDTLVLRCIQE